MRSGRLDGRDEAKALQRPIPERREGRPGSRLACPIHSAVKKVAALTISNLPSVSRPEQVAGTMDSSRTGRSEFNADDEGTAAGLTDD